MIYGYARVSTIAQDHAGQVVELTDAGCVEVFAEKLSGKAGSKRPQLAKLLAALQPGDLVIVTRLNRLARSARDALNLLAAIAATGAGFRSLGEPWADTTTAAGRFMVTIFAGLAEFDREMILARTQEGRQAAKARGVKMGRKHSLSGDQLRFIAKGRAESPPMTLGQLAGLLGVSLSTVRRAARRAADQDYRASDMRESPRDPKQVDLEELTGQARAWPGSLHRS